MATKVAWAFPSLALLRRTMAAVDDSCKATELDPVLASTCGFVSAALPLGWDRLYLTARLSLLCGRPAEVEVGLLS